CPCLSLIVKGAKKTGVIQITPGFLFAHAAIAVSTAGRVLRISSTQQSVSLFRDSASGLSLGRGGQAVKTLIEVGGGLWCLFILGPQGGQNIALGFAADLTVYIPAQLISLFPCPACWQ